MSRASASARRRPDACWRSKAASRALASATSPNASQGGQNGGAASNFTLLRAQREIAPRQGHCAHRLAAAVGCARVEHRSACGHAGAGFSEVEIELAGLDGVDAIEQFGDHDVGRQQADQRPAALGRRGRVSPGAVHRQEKREGGAAPLVLDQRDRPAEDGPAGLHGALRAFEAQSLRAQVQPEGGVVGRRRLDKSGEVEIRARVVAELLHCEQRRAVGVLGGDEGVETVALDTLDEAERPYAGKLDRQVA